MGLENSKEQEKIPYEELLNENYLLSVEIHSLKREIQNLKARLEEAEELKRAISEGDLDALVIPGREGDLIFTLDSADRAYRILVETMKEGTVTFAFDGTILYCNRSFAELLKMDPQAVVGTSIFRYIAPESAGNFSSLMKYAAGTEEIKLKTNDNALIPVYVSISSIPIEGTQNSWCLVAADLTEQKKNEEIVTAERLARSIIEQAAETIAVCDLSGRITRFSKSMPGLCGCNPSLQKFEDIINLQFSEGVDGGRSVFPVSSALKGKTILGLETIFEPEDREKFYLLLNSGPLENSEGEILGCVVTLTDITERKQAEEALQESEKKYRQIVDIAQEGIWLIDSNDQTVFVNQRMAEMLGYPIKEILGKSPQAFMAPEFRLQAKDKLDEHMHGTNHVTDYRFIREDGSDLWGILSSVSLFDDQGEFSGSLAVISDITERKRVEEKLYRSEEIARERLMEIEDLYRNAPVGLCMLDKEFRFVRINEKLAEINGIPAAAHIGKSIREIVPKLADVAEPIMLHVLETGEPQLDLEIVGETSLQPGVKRSWLEKYLPVVDFEGKITGLNVVVEEITDRKKAEEAIKESEQLYRTLFENTEDAFQLLGLIYDEKSELYDWIFLEVNETFELQTGLKASDVLGKHMREIFLDMESYWYSTIDRVAKTGKAERIENYNKDTDRWYDDYIFKYKENQVGILFRNVTKRKQAEKQLNEAVESLKESEERLAEAQRMAHIGNWELDPETGEVYWSEEIYRIFGLDPNEGKLSYDNILSYIHPGDRDYVEKSLNGILSQESKDIDYRIILASGEERILHTHAEANSGENAHPAKIRGTVQDITERSRAEKALEKINKVRIKEIHHRIKNNLQVISSMLDLQAEKFRDENVLEAFKESQNRVISMSLIHEELYKGREPDKLNFSVYIKKLIGNLFQIYSQQEKNIRLSMHLDENTFFDMDTAIPLGIIINELVSNSLKHAFTEKQEGEIQIQLCREKGKNNRATGNHFRLRVFDNGKGIQKGLEIENIEPLGLQLVNILVDQLDGEIELKKDKGTEFIIIFRIEEKGISQN